MSIVEIRFANFGFYALCYAQTSPLAVSHTASGIRECRKGKGVDTFDGGKGIWLDSPMIEMLHGEGTIEKRIPGGYSKSIRQIL